MKPIILIGIVLVLLSALAFGYQGINYTRPENGLDVGLIPTIEETQEPIPLPPIHFGIAMIGGVVLLVADAKQSIKKLDE
jgi:hypothetical protein